MRERGNGLVISNNALKHGYSIKGRMSIVPEIMYDRVIATWKVLFWFSMNSVLYRLIFDKKCSLVDTMVLNRYPTFQQWSVFLPFIRSSL